MDHEARKQMLLTRIALERVQWSHDVEILRAAATPRNIASHALRAVLPAGLERAIFGSSSDTGGRRGTSDLSHRVLQAVLLARRYPILLSLAGGLLARRMIRRVLIIGSFGAAVAGGLWLAQSSRGR